MTATLVRQSGQKKRCLPEARKNRTKYTYDDAGNRTSQIVKDDGVTTATTDCLIDANNPTGYSQTLEQVETPPTGGEDAKATTYVVGLDVIAQVIKDTPTSTPIEMVYLYDGHGSVRALLNPASGTPPAVTFLNAAQVPGGSSWVKTLTYDAYGNAFGFDAATCVSELQYSGESHSASTGLDYLRARWYDRSLGRFGQLDDYAGDLQSPLSLHRYMYAQGNPVQNVDPTGRDSLVDMLGALAIQGLLRGIQYGCSGAIAGAVYGALDAALGGGSIDDILDEAFDCAMTGAVIGFGIGFLGPFATTFLAPGVVSALITAGAGASLALGLYGGISSFADGRIAQGIFRIGVGAYGYSRLRSVATAPLKPVNIGGEGEVSNTTAHLKLKF